MKKQKLTNQEILNQFLGYDFKAIVKVNYDNMKNEIFEVFEIVSNRVTIKSNRLIDFNINEVELIPVSYNEKERLYINNIIKSK